MIAGPCGRRAPRQGAARRGRDRARPGPGGLPCSAPLVCFRAGAVGEGGVPLKGDIPPSHPTLWFSEGCKYPWGDIAVKERGFVQFVKVDRAIYFSAARICTGTPKVITRPCSICTFKKVGGFRLIGRRAAGCPGFGVWARAVASFSPKSSRHNMQYGKFKIVPYQAVRLILTVFPPQYRRTGILSHG